MAKGLAAKLTVGSSNPNWVTLLLMLCEDISTLMVRGKPVARVTKTKQKEKKNKQTSSLCSLLLNLQHNEETKCGETNCHL